MATYRGEGRLLTLSGAVIEPRVEAWISDDDEGRPSYAKKGHYGEVWISKGDLMDEPLRSDPNCVLEWLEVAQPPVAIRVNSWTDGGLRAQVVVKS